MFQVGEFVVYGIHGVCRVKGTEKQLVNRKRTEYLVLEPLGQSEAKFLLPTQSAVAMAKLKPVLSRAELEALMSSDLIRQDCWINEENARKQHYRDLISNAERVSLLQMVHALYRYRDEQLSAGKKFHQCDDNFLRDAEKLLCSEISLVMELDAEQSRLYLREHLR